MASKIQTLLFRRGIVTALGALTALTGYFLIYKPYTYKKEMQDFESEARYLYYKQSNGERGDQIEVNGGDVS